MNEEIRQQLNQIDAESAASMPTDEEVLAMLQGEEVGTETIPEPTASLGDELPEPEQEPEQLTAMDDDELLSILGQERDQAIGGDDESELSGDIARAYEYYFGNQPTQPKAGRSAVVSTDVADMTEALLAEILPTFVQDLSVEFESDGEQDEETSQAESDLCNKVVQQENQGFILWYTLVKSALLEKNCVAKVSVEEDETFTRQFHQVLNPMMLAQIDEQSGQDVEITVEDYSHQDNMGNAYNVTLRLTRRKRHIKVRAVPLAHIKISGTHNSISLVDCPYICHEEELPASKLVEMGYDPEVVADLPTASNAVAAIENAKSQYSQETDQQESDPSTRPILVREEWIKVDYDGDGIAELRRVVSAGAENGTILENTEESSNGFASGTAFIMPGKWLGLSLFDKLKEVQDSKTDFLRQAHDNAKTANNARLGYVVGEVNADDLFNSKPGGGVRMKTPNSIAPIPHTNVVPDILQMLGYEDKQRTERAGAALDMHSQQLPVPGDTAHGAERMMSAKEMLSALITKTLSETVVRDIYLHVHRMIREHFQGEQTYKRSNAWQTTDPSQWPMRERVSVTVGMSHGERVRQQGALGGILQQQMQMFQVAGPGVLVDIDKIHNTLTDFARMAGLNNVTQYWIDPQSPESMRAQQQNQMMQQQQQAQMQQQQQMLLDLQFQLQQMQEETKRAKAQSDAQLELLKLRQNQGQHEDKIANDLTQMELDAAAELNNQRTENLKAVQGNSQ